MAKEDVTIARGRASRTNIRTTLDECDRDLNELFAGKRTQAAPAAKTVSVTLTAAEILAGLITVNQGAAGASALTLPLATAADTAFADAVANDAFDFHVINISTVGAEDATVTTNTGWTLVGGMVVESNDSTAARSSGHFRARKTGTGAWTLYRLA